MVLAVYREQWLWSAIILWLAIASDVADGILARRLEQVTQVGGVLDHSADAVFVSSLLGTLAWQGLIPIVLPVLVVLAFIQYVLDSSTLKGQPLRASYLGRYNGIAYFVLGGWPVMQQALGLYLLSDNVITYLAWGLVASTLISMVDRAFALYRLRRG